MAFVTTSAFLPRVRLGRGPSTAPTRPGWRRCVSAPRRAASVMTGSPPSPDESDRVRSADAMEFFRHRQGKWTSYRVTHHLAFRRAESGESEISMECLSPEDPRIQELCRDNEVDPALTQGGCHVTWEATMAWDQEGENHKGETIFALVPDEDDVRKGKMLRDRGYAEIIPIAGTYFMDNQDALNLETPYEGGAVVERFEFDGPDIVNRVSTVKRFGGYSTATMSTEQRIKAEGEEDEDEDEDPTDEELIKLALELPLFATEPSSGDFAEEIEPTFKRSISPWSVVQNSGESSGAPGMPATSAFANAGAPPSTSAFSTGFGGGGGAKVPTTSAFSEAAGTTDGESAGEETGGDAGDEVAKAARKAGIDLSKVPPSMRDDFLASLQKDSGSTE